ncbi:hypothetical protein NMY22_g12544 [Coprinellus aureogranulatus]|nr:hypothetical protein NMY22_g12544 [Coprinellus aureogranulatus]
MFVSVFGNPLGYQGYDHSQIVVPRPFTPEEEAEVSSILKEIREAEEIAASYNRELRSDMNAFAEAYVASTIEAQRPVQPSVQFVDLESEIQRLAADKRSWESSPNPDRKEDHMAQIVSRDEPRYPAQANAALRQLMEQESAAYFSPRSTTSPNVDRNPIPVSIPAQSLQLSDTSGNARLLSDKERKGYAEYPETAIGKVFRIEGGREQSEDIFKVRGVLSVEEGKEVYLVYPNVGDDALGSSLEGWKVRVNPEPEQGVRVYEIVKK